jgi:hypothetical protein
MVLLLFIYLQNVMFRVFGGVASLRRRHDSNWWCSNFTASAFNYKKSCGSERLYHLMNKQMYRPDTGVSCLVPFTIVVVGQFHRYSLGFY